MEAPLYLDHAATTPPYPEALQTFFDASGAFFANPGSLHAAGAEAQAALRHAKRGLAQTLGAPDWAVVLTASGTESNHLGVQGLAHACRPRSAKPRVLIGAMEHPAVGENAQALEADGFLVETIPVDTTGRILPEVLEPLLGPDVALIAIQWANNEIGGLNPISDLATLARQRAPQAAFHVDGVQAAAKRPEPLMSLGVDSIAVAAHKIGGVRGTAALFLRPGGPRPRPTFHGGGHEEGLRSGTENVAGAMSFAVAADLRMQALRTQADRYSARRSALAEALTTVAPDMVTLGPTQPQEIQGSILTVAFPGVRAETLLHKLELHGIQCGSGSACSAHGHTESPALLAMQVPEGLRNSILRFSINGDEREEDLHRVAQALQKALND